MKKFFFNIFRFCSILLIINIVLYFIVNKYYFKPYEEVDLDYETYLFSDSHGNALGETTKNLNFYNFSKPSESYDDIFYKIQYLIKHSKIKRVILTADDHTLSSYREKMNNIDRSCFYREIDANYKLSDVLDIFKYKYIKRYLVFLNIKSRDILKAYFKSKTVSNDFHKNNVQWVNLKSSLKKKKALNRFKFQFKEHKISVKLTKTLIDIINICKKNKIQLTAIKFPISKEYYSMIENNSFKADSILKKNRIKVFDFKKIYLNYDNYFYDQDHLNKFGSEKFKLLLKKTIIKKLN